MKFKSIRSRLAFSFAGIALFVAIALGAVLLPILQNYYANLELDYMQGNAKVISNFVTDLLQGNDSHDVVQSQIENLAFLSQTRVQVFDTEGHSLYDTGLPQNLSVNLGVMKQALNQANTPGAVTQMRVISVLPNDNAQLPTNGAIQVAPTSNGNELFIYHSVQAGGSPFGFYLNGEAVLRNSRSNLVVSETIADPKSARKLGTVILSDGPAYGSAVIASVIKGWVPASVIAVLLAAVVGWLISRRFSAPVLALTDVTSQMAQGNLSSRASARSQDEFGQLARSFNEMADQVEATVSTLRTFVSDAAHEINTPLTALKTNLELARNEHDPRLREEFIQRSIEQDERLEHLANELLDLSRLEDTQSVRDFESFDIHDLVTQIAERFASRAEQAGRKFNLILPNHEMPVWGSRQQIQRALDNLLENALKFTQADGSITLEAGKNEQGVILTVSDTGIGILPDDLPTLFQRFHRGHNSSEYSGNGLGLAIAKAIVTLHDGTIEAQSTGEGKGSTFLIKLPHKAG